MNNKSKFIPLIVLSLSGLMMSGCGGGDKGSDGNPLQYNGLTTPVPITEENAKEVISTGLEAQSSGNALDGMLGGVSIDNNSTSDTSGISIRRLAQRLATTLSDSQQGFSLQEAMLTGITQQITGSCGGSATLTGDETSFTSRFVNFCDENDFDTDGLTFNGSLSMKSLTDSQASAYGVEMSFQQFSVKGSDGANAVDILMSGTMRMSSTTDGFIMSMNFFAVDNLTGEQVKLENYTVTTQIAFNSETSELSVKLSYEGRVYVGNIGYIDITTQTPLAISGASGYTAGQITFSGANGSVAVLTITGPDSYTLAVNGNTTETGNVSNLAGFQDLAIAG